MEVIRDLSKTKLNQKKKKTSSTCAYTLPLSFDHCLRFLLGIGIGGDYPLSACITSEVAAVKIRGRMMTAVFASQGIIYL